MSWWQNLTLVGAAIIAAAIAEPQRSTVGAQPMPLWRHCPERAPEAALVRCLDRIFGQAAIWQGTDANGVLWRLYVDAEQRRWTLTILNPGNKVMTIVGEGQDWSLIPWRRLGREG